MRNLTAAVRTAAATLVVVAVITRPAAGQTVPERTPGELVTDRPDFTESSSIVAPGFLQFESGLHYESSAPGGVATRSLSAPGALLRIGLTPRIELRVGADGYLADHAAGLTRSGYSDMDLGVKVRLFDRSRSGFDLAVIPMASLPVGSEPFSSGGVDPTLKLTFARDLGGPFEINANVNVGSVSGETSRFVQKAYSASLGCDLPAGFGSFLEVYAFSPMDQGTRTGTTFDAGLSHQVGPDFQLDVEAGHGLTAAAPDWFFGFGFVIRRHR